MRPRALLLASLAASLLTLPLLTCPPRAQAQAQAVSAEERAAFHRDPQWLAVAPHLPDPKTASGAELETAGDVLRARRFMEDALDYYGYAIARGAPVTEVMNKMGVVRLQLRQIDLAHELFHRTVRAKKKDPVGWNNLGVTEYLGRNFKNAIVDYKHASRLDKTSAVYHSNLGMAYFESGDPESARKQFSVALTLNPEVFDQRENGGTTAAVVGSQNYAQLAFEMAKVYARHHNDDAAILWLSKATEAGFDTKHGMLEDAVLRPYASDPRVILMLRNAQELREHSVAVAAPTQSLGPAAANEHIN